MPRKHKFPVEYRLPYNPFVAASWSSEMIPDSTMGFPPTGIPSPFASPFPGTLAGPMPVEPGRSWVINNQPYGFFDQNGQPRDPFLVPPNGFPLMPLVQDPNFPNFPYGPYSPFGPTGPPFPGVVTLNNGGPPGWPMPWAAPPANSGKYLSIFYVSNEIPVPVGSPAGTLPTYSFQFVLVKTLNPRSDSYGLYSESHATRSDIRNKFKDVVQKKKQVDLTDGGFTFNLVWLDRSNPTTATKLTEMVNQNLIQYVKRNEINDASKKVDNETIGLLEKMIKSVEAITDVTKFVGGTLPGTTEERFHKLKEVGA